MSVLGYMQLSDVHTNDPFPVSMGQDKSISINESGEFADFVVGR
jgi:hypothetical protein